MRWSRVVAALVVLAVLATGCSGGEGADSRTMTAYFERAVQVFPGNSVRVLGVSVGRVTDVENAPDQSAVAVTFRIDDPDVRLPSDVQATIVPVSLLGERYVQLYPAYRGGPEFTGARIPMARTNVPVEQDELLRSVQDYFGNLDPKKVARFVDVTARVLEGNGEDLNRLIESGTGVVGTLADKRDRLAALIVQFNTLTHTLSTRQSGIADLINDYNAVARALNENRAALEGTITGLNEAAAQLAALLVEHRDPLGKDIKTLTRTARTLSRNAERFAETGKWANRLFTASGKGVDYDRNWVRLSNQGAPLVELIEFRLRDRLVGVCLRLEMNECATQSFWSQEMPDLFCLQGSCPDGKKKPTPGDQLESALEELPDEVGDEIAKELGTKKKCKDAKNPKRCRKRKEKEEALDPGETLDDLLQDLQDDLDETIGGLTGGLP